MNDPFGLADGTSASYGPSPSFDSDQAWLSGDVPGLSGGIEGAGGSFEFVGPPWWWLAAGAGISAIGATLAWVTSTLPLAIVGWFLAGPLGLSLAIWYTNRENDRKASGRLLTPGWLPPTRIAALVLCLAAVILAAIRVAIGIGRS